MLYHLTSQINIKKTFSSRLLHPPRPPDTAHRDARLGVMLGAYGRASRLYAFPEPVPRLVPRWWCRSQRPENALG